MSRIRDIALVGHCGFDASSLRRAVEGYAPEASVTMVNSSEALSDYLRPDALLLVNRVLDGRFDTGSGVELIGALAGGPGSPAMMLVSNYDDAQRAAREAGALPGFGKAQLHDPDTADRLRAVVRGDAPAEA